MKYWAYVNNEILGPYEKEKLFELPVFTASTLICPQTPVGEKTEDWKEASTYPEVASLLNSHGAPTPASAPAPAPGQAAPAATPQPGGAQLPKPGTLQPSGQIERPAPVFNTEMPESKLKPLSLHKIDQAPAAGAVQPSPSFTSAGFDPMTLSQIGKRADAQQADPVPTGEGMSTLSQIDKRAGAQRPETAAAGNPQPEIKSLPAAQPAAAPAPDTLSPALHEVPALNKIEDNRSAAFSPAAAPAPVPAPAPAAESPAPAPAPAPSFAAAPQSAPVDQKSFEEINSKLEALGRTALTKQDIEPLKEKLGQMGEVLSSMKNSQFQRDIMDKIQYLESSLSEIKTSLAQAPAVQKPQPAAIESTSAAMLSPQPAKEASVKPAETVKPAQAAKPEATDQGSSGKASKFAAIGGILKKIFKLLITLVLLTAVLGVAAYALKNYGIFDVTKFLPFQVPYLSSTQTEAPGEAGQASTAANAQAFPQSGEARPADQTAAQGTQAQTKPAVEAPATPQAAPAKKDLSDEIIYIGRTYALKADGSTLENMIEKDAAAKRGDFNRITWEVKEMADGMFQLSGHVPLTGKSGQVVYSYQVDYARKSVKALDEMSKKPLDALIKGPASLKPAQTKKGRAAAGAKQPRPAAKSAKAAKAKPAADEEYEYVYEEDPGGTEE